MSHFTIKRFVIVVPVILAVLGSFFLMRTAANAGFVDAPTLPGNTDLLVSSYNNDSVLRYDGTTGSFVSAFVSGGSGGLYRPQGLTYGLDGNLYVSSSWNEAIKRYDGATGAYINDFVPVGSGGLSGPIDLLFGPDGNLYVGSINNNRVLRYDGTTGAFIDTFVPPGSGGLLGPTGMIYGPDGNLYISSLNNNRVMRYDGATGAYIDTFVAPGSGGLSAPGDVRFGPDGNLYVRSGSNNSVLRYDGTTGAFIGAFVPSGSGGLTFPQGVAYGPDSNFYVSSFNNDSVLRYDGTTGAFIGAFVTSSSGGLDGPAYLIFHEFPPVTGTPASTPTSVLTPTSVPTSVPTNTALPTSTPLNVDAFALLQPSGPITVTLGDRFVLDLFVNAGSNNVTAAQSYMTFTHSVIQAVNVSQEGCVLTSTALPDVTTFDAVLQNEICNGPDPCVFRGTTIGPGSIAYASGALTNCDDGCPGDFRVAQIGFCASAEGDGVIHWQFSPPDPPMRHSEIVSVNGERVANRTLYTDYAVHVTSPGMMVGHVTWQGRPAQPDPLQQMPITLTLTSGTKEIDFEALHTDANGYFTVSLEGLVEGVYSWRVKEAQYLANTGNIELTGNEPVEVEMGIMLAGDCNNDNIVNVSDFNILKNTFGLAKGEPEYDGRANFNGDSVVNASDFNLLRQNFGRP